MKLMLISMILIYSLPTLIILFPSMDRQMFLFIVLFIINPLYHFLMSLIYVKKERFKWYIPVVLAFGFLIDVILFYPTNTMIFVVIYLICGYLAYFIDQMLNKGENL